MAGHSKWANIKHRKDGADKRRGILFTKLSKEIMIAARLGGADISANSRLRIAVSRSRSCNMPRDTIERAIKKGTGDLDGISYEEITYAVFATGGVALMIEGLTDKKSRTTPEIKSILTKHNASLTETNAVLRLFERRGYISIATSFISEEKLLEIAIEAGAQDVRNEGDYYVVLSSSDDYANISEVIADNKIETIESGIQMLPVEGTAVSLSNPEQVEKLFKLIEILEEHDDIQAVHSNLNMNNDES